MPGDTLKKVALKATSRLAVNGNLFEETAILIVNPPAQKVRRSESFIEKMGIIWAVRRLARYRKFLSNYLRLSLSIFFTAP